MTGAIRKDQFVMIIGAMKSGTSSLYELITKHPEICACKYKEPEYFSTNQSHKVEVDHYEDLWDIQPGKHRYFMEASTGYTKFPEEIGVPERISQYGLDPYFIYIVRDPIARIQSEFNYLAFHPFLKKVDDPTSEFYISKSKYYLQLSHFLSVFPDKKKYLIIDFEYLKRDSELLSKQVFSFLGIPTIKIDPEIPKNETPDVSNIELLFRTRYFYWLRNLIPEKLRGTVRDQLVKMSGKANRTLSPQEKQQIKKELAGDMESFAKEFKFDVSRWGF